MTSSIERPTLEGFGYVLRPFGPDEVDDRYVSWLTDPDVVRFLEVRLARQTRETALAFVRSFYGEVEKYIWRVFPAGEADPIGTTTLYNINRHHGWTELGLMIGEKAFWGRGASEATLRLLASFAFDHLGLRRLTGGTYANHYGMNFTYRKLGFTLEGRLRKALAVSPGCYVDSFRWGLLADEWRQRTVDAHQS